MLMDFFSFSITPLNLTAVLSFEDIRKGVKVLPTTEVTALMSNKYCRNVQSGFWQALTFSLKEQPDNTQAKVSTSALHQPSRSCPTASFKTSFFWHLGKDMDHLLPDCCHPKLTCIYLQDLTSNNTPLEPKSVLIHHSQILYQLARNFSLSPQQEVHFAYKNL